MSKIISVDGVATTVADDDPRLPPAPTFATLQASQIAALSAACAAEITGGYQSSALMAVHTYPSGLKDQVNMLGSVSDSLIPDLPADWTTPFWCADASGTWSFQMHTATQIRQAGRDGKAAVVAAQDKLATLSAKVMAASSAEAVTALVW